MIDCTVKVAGVPYRLIGDQGKAGIFGPDGLVYPLDYEEGGPWFGLPDLFTADGAKFQGSRVGKPCSCKGFPWNVPINRLLKQLGE